MSNQNGSTNVHERFKNFFNGWLGRQQSFLEQLHLHLSSSSSSSSSSFPNSHIYENEYRNREEERKWMIEQVMSHYQEYYDEKSRAASEDVFAVFSAPWLSSLERTFLWIAGFKPTIILRLARAIVADSMSPEQLLMTERIEAETRQAEKETTERMASVQESVAAPPLLTVARRAGRVMDGMISSLDGDMERVKTAMIGVLQRADGLRVSTVGKVVEVLNTEQKVRFLIGVAEFQLRIRRWGVDRDDN